MIDSGKDYGLMSYGFYYLTDKFKITPIVTFASFLDKVNGHICELTELVETLLIKSINCSGCNVPKPLPSVNTDNPLANEISVGDF